jgi:hypothetical protein
LDDTNFVLPGNEDIDYYTQDVYDIPLQRESVNGDLLNGDSSDNVDNEPEQFDRLIGATFLLDPLAAPGNVATTATVVKRKLDPLGVPLGKYHLVSPAVMVLNLLL